MQVISRKPTVFLTLPAIEDSRIDFDFNNPEYVNYFDENYNIDPLGKYIIEATYGTSDKCHETALPDDVAVLRMNNIVDGKLKPDNLVFIEKENVTDLLLNKNDILINRTNSKELVGKCALYDDQLIASFASYIIRIKVDETKLFPPFVVLYLTAKHGRNEINRRSCGTANQYNISIGHIKSFAIPELPTNFQETIYKRYYSFDNFKVQFFTFKNKVLSTSATRRGLEVDTVYASELVLGSFLVKKGQLVFLRDYYSAERLDVPANHPDYTLLVDQIKSSPASGIISDLVKVSENRFNPDDHIGEEVNYLAIGDIDGISGRIIAQQTMLADELPSRARRLIRSGDILVGIAGASTGTENMVVFPVTDEQNGWIATTGFLVLQPKEHVDINYVCRLIKAPFVLRQIRALLTSPAMPTISESDLLAISVPVTNQETRGNILSAIITILSEDRNLVKRLDAVSGQIESLLAHAKSNIFDLLDDAKFAAMSAKSEEIKRAMAQIEEALQ